MGLQELFGDWCGEAGLVVDGQSADDGWGGLWLGFECV